ncbi:MAG: sigma 54-interacting transcriptional regulator [Desulfovibrionaceae bacterium]|nr:sigma 54-interacting transcriptional regulator [Desulfovibrionaceae bacterium]
MPPLKSSKSALKSLDAVLATAHLLPQQKSIFEILRMLKFCCTPLWPFQREILMIEPPLQEYSRMYIWNPGESSDCTRVDLPLEDKYVWYRQAEPLILDKSSLEAKFPHIAKGEIFKDLKSCLILPLPVNVPGYYAMLIFIRTLQAKPFKPNVLDFAQVLRGLVTSSLSRLLQREEESKEVAALRLERDQLNILTAVTNVAISTLDIGIMLEMLASDLRRFFGVKDVGMALWEPNEQVSLSWSGNPSSSKILIPEAGSILRLLTPLETPKILSHKALLTLETSDPLAKYFLAHGNHAVCAVPLIFQKTLLGTLLLAHENREVFTHESVSLLAQIGRSVASAVKNSREYTRVNLTVERLAQENAYLSSEITSQFGGQIIGQSPSLKKVLYQVSQVAPSDSTVLILGETGTGKELFAEAIHAASSRKNRRMVKINCAAIPENLLENELFVHEKGAFTGALNQTKGRFELADQSTIFLDEVGDMPLALQPKLLRVLQQRELERLGGHSPIPVDVRLVAATNQNLWDLVQKKTFREDLYYRLNVFPIHLPPLRERREDIPLLAAYFMQQQARKMKKEVCEISQKSLDWLISQPWPGNIRELANVIERAVILSSGKVLNLDGYANTPTSKETLEPKPNSNLQPKALSQVEEIKAAVRACNGLIAGPRGAAAKLGLNRTTLNSRMKRLGLDVKSILNGE